MPRDLFTDTSSRPATVRSTRLLPISLIVHAALAAGVIVVPLFALGELPPVRSRPTAALIVETTLPKVELPPERRDVPPVPPANQNPATENMPPAPPPVGPADPPVNHGAPIWVPGSGDFVEGFPAIGPPAGERGGTGVTGGPPAAPDKPIAISRGIQRPRKVKDVQPVYPAIARQAGIEGTVVIDAVIGPDGRVRQAEVRESAALLDRAALDAVKQWEFTPTLLNGVPVAVVMTVEVRFKLGR